MSLLTWWTSQTKMTCTSPSLRPSRDNVSRLHFPPCLSTKILTGVIAAIFKNEILLPNKIAALNAGVGLPAMIPPDMRAVSVKVNDVVGVAGFVGPGTRVDVLVTGSPSNNTQDTVTTTVLENVEVLAAGQKIQPNAEGKPENVPVITLLVTPADAQTLTLASTEGKIQL